MRNVKKASFGYLKNWDTMTERIGLLGGSGASLYHHGQPVYGDLLVDYQAALG